MPNLCGSRMAHLVTMRPMTSPEAAATRTLALELPESEWQALRALEPDAVGWLKTLIRSRVNQREESADVDAFDEY